MTNRIVVGSLVHDRVAGGSRISADVGGELLWFESFDTELRLSPEGFASALLVPAMSLGRDLFFEDPLCPVWLENAQKLMEYFSKWFGWNPIKIESYSLQRNSTRTQTGKRVLCFSGGVDSFYSLLTYPKPIDALVFVHGYDIRLDDETGARISFEHVRKVALEMKLDAVLIRTNYREHSIAGRKYKYAYGGALAGVGHFFCQVSELIISSGLRYDEVLRNGSQWQTDALWSSEFMKVVHYGAHLAKDDKIRAIATNSLMRRHLRVCQQIFIGRFGVSENFLNCGCCQKCIQTLIVFQQEGDIGDLENFRNKTDFDVHLDNVQQCNEYLFETHAKICGLGVDKKTELALRALVRRSKVLNRMGWAGRKGRKVAYQVFRVVDAVERKIFCNRV